MSNPSSHLRIKYGYVYALVAADLSVIKIGKAKDRSQLSARISAQRNYFLFNLSDSFCFRFEDEFRAFEAEQSLLFKMRDWREEFVHPFPGYTEYLIGASRNDIFKWMLNTRPRGFISMEHVLDELKLEDYEMPFVTVHATLTPPVSYSVS